MQLAAQTAALKAWLEARPGATGEARSPPRGAPNVMIFKVMGRMFAILSLRGAQQVIVKCDAHLAETLRETYAGVGRRSHLDPRFWICVQLDADVPEAEIFSLAGQSYDLVRAGLTRKQQAELAGLPP